MASSQPQHIIVLGAGISGLQTALSLLTTPITAHYKITIIAEHTPGDLSPAYTSPWAGGHWRSHATSPTHEDAEQREWDKRTYEFWSRLLHGNEKISPHVEGGNALEKAIERMRLIGLGEKESRNYWGSQTSETIPDGSGLWWSKTVKNFSLLDLEAERQDHGPNLQAAHFANGNGNGGVAPSAVFGIKHQSICINIPTYLSFLFSTVTALGANVIKTSLPTTDGLSGVVATAKQIILAQHSEIKAEAIFALVNCTGLSARLFVGEQAGGKLFPIRGQTILVKGEAAMARTCTDFSSPDSSLGDELVYVIPRPGSGTTILGGCKQVGNYDSEVDEELSKRILRRVRDWGLGEELRTGKDGMNEGFEVLSMQVGFRPGRKGGPRVEIEDGGKVEGLWVVHAYGHGGAGYQNSVGSAEKVVRLVEGCRSREASL